MIEPALAGYFGRKRGPALRRPAGGDGLQPHGGRQAPAAHAGAGVLPRLRRRRCGGPARSLRRRDAAHLQPHPRRPALHGRRRPAPRQADQPQGLRRDVPPSWLATRSRPRLLGPSCARSFPRSGARGARSTWQTQPAWTVSAAGSSWTCSKTRPRTRRG